MAPQSEHVPVVLAVLRIASAFLSRGSRSSGMPGSTNRVRSVRVPGMRRGRLTLAPLRGHAHPVLYRGA